MLEELLTRETLHGLVVVYRLPHWSATADVLALNETLLGQERDPLKRYAARRQVTYAGGRYVLRKVLTRLGAPLMTLGIDDRGAPILPEGFRGSISHKDDVVAALGTTDISARFGVDIEEVPGPSDALADKILTSSELAAVLPLPDPQRALELALRFSVKEAIYKALDPYVRRYVAHSEVEVWPQVGGGARVVSEVWPSSREVTVTWERIGHHVLSTARL
ncbi:MAG: 4'-phosphopantetheinyl transferase superfamily protein [Clostridia bacterium]|nr:4'-phosphopantetheinyl transferase superfamily protein [Deltaproteobacteria bacterium]